MDGGVGAGDAGPAGHHLHRRGARQRSDEPGRGLVEVLRQEHHDRPHELDARRWRVAGGVQQICRVVPLVCQPCADVPVQADQVRGQRRRGADRVEPRVGHVAERAVGLDQRAYGGVVFGHRRERTGVGVERAAPRGSKHRAGHRAPSARGQQRCGEHLGEPRKRDDRESGDACVRGQIAAREGAASDHAAEVAGNDEGERGQRIAGLDPADRAAEHVVGRRAVAGCHSLDRNREPPFEWPVEHPVECRVECPAERPVERPVECPVECPAEHQVNAPCDPR